MSHPGLRNLGNTFVDREWFIFTHSMAHRELLGVMGPLSNLAVYPYDRMLDPMLNIEAPGARWHQVHQTAHGDAQTAVPTTYGSKDTGLLIGGNLIDYNLDDEEQRQWWLLQNHFQHYVMGSSVSPFPGAPPATPAPGWWTNQTNRYLFPFW